MVGGWWSYCLWMCNFTSLEKHPSKSPAWTVGCIGPRAPTYIPVRKCCLAHWDGKMASRWQTEKEQSFPDYVGFGKNHGIMPMSIAGCACDTHVEFIPVVANMPATQLYHISIATGRAWERTSGDSRSPARHTFHFDRLEHKIWFTTCIFSSRSRLPPRDMKIFVIICYPSKQTSCI